MARAKGKQTIQDWFTQQWVIWWGRRIDKNDHKWLIGPFGKKGIIADQFIEELAKNENLSVKRNTQNTGLLASIDLLNVTIDDHHKLNDEIIRFYEKTANYQLFFDVKWNPIFKFFGQLVNGLFSKRINQLNIPLKNTNSSKDLHSEIIKLVDEKTKKEKYTIWYRTFKSTGEVVYSGIYSTCQLPSGKTCVKAVFPLPYGNATVIMYPEVTEKGELKLISAGKKFGDAGFYFLLEDKNGDLWSRYIRSFKDVLTVSQKEKGLFAEQILSLWGMRVTTFNYKLELKDK